MIQARAVGNAGADKLQLSFIQEIVCQNLCGCQSKSKPRRHLQIFVRRRGNLASLAPTKTRVGTESFQLQRWVRRILEKFLMRGTGGFFDAGWKRMVSLPEFFSAQ